VSARVRGDDGQVGGVEGVIFGVLVFVIGVLVVANAWGVVDAKLAASAAAREAVRTFVESRRTSTAAAFADAHLAAEETIVAHGRSLDRFRMDAPPGLVLARCSRVTLTVTYRVPLVSIPVVGHVGSGFTVTGRHSELVDPFRSGLPDRGSCP
jgi:hypothetical protein